MGKLKTKCYLTFTNPTNLPLKRDAHKRYCSRNGIMPFLFPSKFLSKLDVHVELLVAADAHPCAPWWLHGRQKACAKVIHGLLRARRTYPSCKPHTHQISRVRKNQQLWLAGNIYRHRLLFHFNIYKIKILY